MGGLQRRKVPGPDVGVVITPAIAIVVAVATGMQTGMQGKL